MTHDHDDLVDLICELDFLLAECIKSKTLPNTDWRVRAFVREHEDVPGFKECAIAALIEAEQEVCAP